MTGERYGYFDRQAHEYVITDPRTPMPWMNYLLNDNYTALVSATGGGYSFYRSAKDCRILRYRLNNLPMDRPGRYCYLRDRQTGDFWSANWAPVQRETRPASFECRHGFGYTRIRHNYSGIATVLTYTVPPDDALELWVLRITNCRDSAARLVVFPYAEFCIWRAAEDLSNFQWSYNIVRCRGEGNMIHNETMTRRFGNYALFATSANPAAYDCDREVFVGPARSEADPSAVETGHCSNVDCYHGNPIAAFEIPVSLAAGESREISFVLGVSVGKTPPEVNYEPYLAAGAQEHIRDQLREQWQGKLATQTVHCPDPDTNLCLNSWHPYQAQVTFRQSRGPSIYEGGIRRGMGYRDSCQDTLGVMHVEHRRVRDRLRQLAGYQLRAGSSVHQFFPESKEWQPGLHRDTHLWLVFAVGAYLRETGDLSFLSERIPYVDGGEATLYEHLAAAIDFSWRERGQHGLCKLGKADWNDGLQCPLPDDPFNERPERKEAESVLISQLLVQALDELSSLADRTGDAAGAAALQHRRSTLVQLINETAWDGDWYLRCFKNDGTPLGSSSNPVGKLWLNTQSWAVLSGVASEARGRRAMDAVQQQLENDYGLCIFAPPFPAYDASIGGLSDCPPGLKENGGIFCHPNPWAIIAETRLGRGDRAYRYYAKLRPTEYDKRQPLHSAEPYVYCQMIVGPAHPRHGLARNSWLTGTVAWMYAAATQHILGIRPELDGLRIDPCIPGDWDGFEVVRHFRGKFYRIRIVNPEHVCCGVSRLQVDGALVPGNVIPPAHAPACQVLVTMGKDGVRHAAAIAESSAPRQFA